MRIKTTFLSLTLIFTYSSIFSQEYIPLPEENAVWTEAHSIPEHSIWTTLYEISGDTMLNEKTYKKIYEHTLFMGDTTISLFAFFRQNPENEMAFIIRHYFDETDEKVLYNLDVNIGDTVEMAGLVWPEIEFKDFILTGVDSVMINLNGEYRKRYHFYTPSGLDIGIIEGIGEIHCPFGPYSIWIDESVKLYGSPIELICLEYENEMVYGWDELWCGELITNMPESNVERKFSISPNPTKGDVIIKYEITVRSEDPELIIRNSFGQIIYRLGLSSSENEKVLDISSLKSGIYYYTVRNLSISGKLIIVD